MYRSNYRIECEYVDNICDLVCMHDRETGVRCDACLGCSKATPRGSALETLPADARWLAGCTTSHPSPSRPPGAAPTTTTHPTTRHPSVARSTALAYRNLPPNHISYPAEARRPRPHSAFARDKAHRQTHHAAGQLSPWPHASSSRRSTRSACPCDVPA